MDADWNDYLKAAQVLILDDSQMFRTATAGMLYKIGFHPDRVHQAADGASALRHCRNRTMDLVLCDYNLGGGADGLSFFDQLQTEGLLPATSIFVIITGDANTSVFLSFSEHSPDDYLIKPINFAALRERLMRIHNRKKLIGPIQQALATGKLDDAHRHLEQAQMEPAGLGATLEILHARLLIAEGRFSEGYNLLTAQYNRLPDDNCLLELARLMRRQGRPAQALTYLDSLKNRGPLLLQGLILKAEIQIQQQDFEVALDLYEQALQLAGHNGYRHYLCGLLALICNRPDDGQNHFDAAMAAQAAAMKPSPMPLLQAIRLRLDHAQQANEKSLNSAVMEIAGLLKELRTMFSDQKESELLIKCRLKTLAGNIVEAQQHLHHYLNPAEGSPPRPVESLELLDCARCQFNLCLFDEALGSLEKAQQLARASADDSNEALILAKLIAKMTAQMADWRRRALEIRKRGAAALNSNNPITAVESLLQAHRIMPADAESAFLLLHALCHAWPRGYSINQTARLALRLKTAIKTSAYANNPELQRHCAQLAEQLQMPELAAT